MNWRKMLTYLFAAALLLILLPIVSLAQEPTGQPSAAQAAPGAAKPQPAAVGVDHFIYEQFALSPDGKADFFIAFWETADLTPAYSMDWHDRGHFVVDTLKAVADRSQANVRKWLEERGIRYTVFWINNTIFVHADEATLNALKAFPEVSGFRGNHVAQIFPDKPAETSPTTSGQIMTPAYPWNVLFPKADQVHAQFGIKGQGVVVGGMDTGVEYTHIGLVKNYRGCVDPPACTVFDHTYSWYDPSNSCGGTPCDTDSHGTATMGIMAGDDDPSLPNGAWIGMAPDAKWIHCIGCPYGSCPDYNTDACAQWFLAPGGDPDLRPQVVNHSWGLWSPNNCNGNDFQAQLMAYRAADIVPAFAAGNVGDACNTSTSPANNTDPDGNPIAFASGAHGMDGSLDYYSSCGWNACNPTKLFPDVASPGLGSCTTGLGNTYNCSFGGTSSASPHTAGCVALVRSANPALTVDQVEQVIRDAADDVDDTSCGGTVDWNNRYGEGHLDCYEAVQLAGVGGMGYLDGHVSDAVTTLPIEGATIKATLSPTLTWQTATNDQGYYTLRVLTGTYTVEAVKYGYQPDQVSGVQVYSGTTTTVDFALQPAAFYVVSGTVTDAATGWPLYARIQIGGYPGAPIWTDPVSGYYSVTLAEGIPYNFHVSAWVDGYLPEDRPVGPLTGNQTEDFALQADLVACSAPGYEPAYAFFDNFEGGYGNWTMTGLWNPESETDVCGSQVAPFPSSSNDAYYGIDGVCTFDNGSANSGALTLVAPVTLPPSGGAVLSFWSYEQTECGGDCYYDNRYVEISTNGGGTWILLGEGNTENVWYKRSFDLTPYLGQNVLLRFRFDTVDSIGNYYFGWMVDDVGIATGCAPTPGGLVVGNVYDANTSGPLDGADVWNDSGEETVTRDGGFYTLFSPAGAHTFTATLEGYSTETALVTVVQSDTVRQDFTLGSGYLTFTPSPLTATVDMGQSLVVSAALANSGTFQAQFEFQEVDKGFGPVLRTAERPAPAGPAFTPQGSSSSQVTVQPFQPRLNQAPILHIYTTETGQSIQRALNELGYTYDLLYAEDWTGVNFAPYDVVIIGMDGGGINEPSLQKVRTDVVDAGKRLIFVGGTCYQPFALGVNQYLVLNNVNDYCWAISSTPHWTLVDPTHPLAEGLPDSYNFTNSSAAYYQIRVNDPDIEPVAINGDGYYNFFYKGAEFPLQAGTLSADGDFIWFINSAYSGYWTNQSDFDLLKQSLYNAINLAAGDVPWLSEEPVSGTVAAGDSLPVTVTFDAGVPQVTQPGKYYAVLKVKNDTPYGPLQIPVTMTVIAPPTYGKLNGTVHGLGYCDADDYPLKEAEVLIESSLGTTWTVETDDAGYYQIWLDQANSPLTVTVTYPEYETGVATGVMVYGQQTTTVDFYLRWLKPCLSVAPDSLSASLPMGQSETQQVTLTNDGAAAAEFEFWEIDRGFQPTLLGAPIEVTIPAGPATAPAGTAVAAGPYTPAPARSQTIRPRLAPEAGPNILLLNADDDNSYSSPIQSMLLAYGDLGAVDLYDARYGTPTLAELQAYDVVLVWSNYMFANPAGIGDVLADYVDAGGKVIDLEFAIDVNWGMQGRFKNEGYSAMVYGSTLYSSACLGTYDPGHPIMEGVTNVCEPYYRIASTSLTPGSTAVAWWNDGQLFVAVKDDHTVVTINDYVGYYYQWTGQLDLLLHNAIFWLAASADVPWLSEEPVSGTVGADGGILVADVTFDAGAVAQPGEYYATLNVKSNDPVNGNIGLPVTLTVSAPADWGKLVGVVSSLGYCDEESYPLEDATVVARNGHVMTVTTNANGEYVVWLPEGTYTVTASAEEHTSSSAVVQITGQQTTTQDFDLRSIQPCISLTPPSMEAVLTPGASETQILTLINEGAGPSDFKIRETTQTLGIELGRGFQPTLPSLPPFTGKVPADTAPSSTGRAPTAPRPSGQPADPLPFVLLGEPAYALDVYPGYSLVYIPNTTMPGTWNVIGSVPQFHPAADFLNGDFSRLYALDYNTNQFVVIDTATAARTVIGTTSPNGDWTGMTGAVDGTLYAVSSVCGTSSTLYTVDPDTGALTLVGNITNGPCIIDIAINAQGEMYGVDIVNDVLVRIDPTTGAGQVVGPIGYSANYAQGMDFEETTGILYLAAFNAGTFQGELRICDTGTGNSVLVGSFPGGDEVDGLAFATFAGGDVPWLSEEPVTGTVEADSTFDVEVTFTALPTMTEGTYTAFLVVRTDDAQNPEINVPVTLTIVLCVEVTDVELTLVTTGTVYPGDPVDFSADILPDNAAKPYSYTVDYGDGTPPVTGSSSDDPLTFSYAYTLPGTYPVEIAVWNCNMAEPVTDTVTVVVEAPCEPVTGVELTLLTTGTLYVGEEVLFGVDLTPDTATPPYSYTLAVGGPVLTADTEPFTFTLSFSTPGTHTVEIAVWNCDMAEPVTGTVEVVVQAPKIYIYLPIIVKNAAP